VGHGCHAHGCTWVSRVRLGRGIDLGRRPVSIHVGRWWLSDGQRTQFGREALRTSMLAA
jgi:hypothetical protein